MMVEKEIDCSCLACQTNRAEKKLHELDIRTQKDLRTYFEFPIKQRYIALLYPMVFLGIAFGLLLAMVIFMAVM